MVIEANFLVPIEVSLGNIRHCCLHPIEKLDIFFGRGTVVVNIRLTKKWNIYKFAFSGMQILSHLVLNVESRLVADPRVIVGAVELDDKLPVFVLEHE